MKRVDQRFYLQREEKLKFSRWTLEELCFGLDPT